ncbi:hypothetical protein KFL_004910050 [Klebsormidium nitens]|uniref:Uncharacterized protein n=1 Tax=Klebsormidium nitens TaxID=105231 RepID=A0A1Y1IKE7_KLENI|nr:hypothetical protein KFL_004910050 [Klebsormidium nitens]|eukprot:GAQ89147.1 hypothetical protein KFL_004910050 [Klebsormidium nitens]
MEVLWVVTETAYSALAPFEVPVNFWLEKSIPQREVLRHPAVAAMITHCGGDGAQGATQAGSEKKRTLIQSVHDLVSAEEYDVAQRLAHAGFPVLDPLRAMPADLSAAVRAVTARDPTTENAYQAKARKIARIFRFLGGAPRAADFVELVAELGTEHQLRTPDLSMSWFVKHKLDLLILVAIFAGVIFLAANVSVRFLVGELL